LQQVALSHRRVTSAHTCRHILLYWLGYPRARARAHTHTHTHTYIYIYKLGKYCPSTCLISKIIRRVLNWVDTKMLFDEIIFC
jgi:hypothetical protein